VDIVGRIVDRTVGAVIRWFGGQWARGRERADRERETLRQVLVAMGDAISEADKLGKGLRQDPVYLSNVAEAEGRLGVLMSEVQDAELIRLGKEFMAACGVMQTFPRDERWTETRTDMRGIRDDAADRIRTLQAKL
jgi:hypothetical protein